MKFTKIVGNPPYQKPNTNQKDDNLWTTFLKNSLDKLENGGYLVFITPASWASLGSNIEKPGSKIFKTCFKPYSVEDVDFTVDTYFDVASTFSAYVMQNKPYENNARTIIRTSSGEYTVDFKEVVCIPLRHHEEEFIAIIKRFLTQHDHYNWIANDPYPIARTSMPDKIKKGDYSNKFNLITHAFRCYHTNSERNGNCIYYSNYENLFHTDWKYVTSYSGTWNGMVTNACSLTDASLCILTDTEAEANSIKSVMLSEPINFLMTKVYNWSGYYSKVFIRSIPKFAINKIWTDDEVYAELFSEDEIKLIKSYIKKRKKR